MTGLELTVMYNKLKKKNQKEIVGKSNHNSQI